MGNLLVICLIRAKSAKGPPKSSSPSLPCLPLMWWLQLGFLDVATSTLACIIVCKAKLRASHLARTLVCTKVVGAYNKSTTQRHLKWEASRKVRLLPKHNGCTKQSDCLDPIACMLLNNMIDRHVA